VPGSAGKHIPSVPGFLQVKQASPQAWSQQTPSTHCADPHSDAVVHCSPSPFDGLSGPLSIVIGTSPVLTMSCPASTWRCSPPPPQAPAVAASATNSAQTAVRRTKATAIDEPFVGALLHACLARGRFVSPRSR
jgi:hypothetical protein